MQRLGYAVSAAVAALLLFVGTATVQGQDLQTKLSYFLKDLYAGTVGTTVPTGFAAKTGTSAAPSYSFTSQAGTGWYYGGDGLVGLGLGSGSTPMILFGGATSSFVALKRNGTQLQTRLADDSTYGNFIAGNVTGTTGYFFGASATLMVSATAPTVSSGFGTSPSIVNSNGTAAFTVNVGTGGVATSGVIGLPTATTGWNCFVIDRTNNTVTRETATTTTTVTLTAAAAWAASDILQVSCFGY